MFCSQIPIRSNSHCTDRWRCACGGTHAIDVFSYHPHMDESPSSYELKDDFIASMSEWLQVAWICPSSEKIGRRSNLIYSSLIDSTIGFPSCTHHTGIYKERKDRICVFLSLRSKFIIIFKHGSDRVIQSARMDALNHEINKILGIENKETLIIKQSEQYLATTLYT